MDTLSGTVVGVRLPLIFVTGFPNTFWNVLVWHLVENTIWGKHNEIMVLLNLELTNFWFGFNYVHVTSSVCKLGFWITKSTRDWETTWKDSYRAYDVFGLAWFLYGAARLFLDFFRISLNALCRSSLVNLASSLDNPLILLNIWWLVIPA